MPADQSRGLHGPAAAVSRAAVRRFTDGLSPRPLFRTIGRDVFRLAAHADDERLHVLVSPGRLPVDGVVDPNGVIAADDLFQGIADRLGGDFDGWEAAGEP